MQPSLFDELNEDAQAEAENARKVDVLNARRKSRPTPKRKPKARARKTDPQSSKDAAAQVEANNSAKHQREAVTDLVFIHPGKTSKELAEYSEDMDRHQVARRLPEAEEAGYIERRKKTGRELTWWPKEAS